jgi:hypothetical protein
MAADELFNTWKTHVIIKNFIERIAEERYDERKEISIFKKEATDGYCEFIWFFELGFRVENYSNDPRQNGEQKSKV